MCRVTFDSLNTPITLNLRWEGGNREIFSETKNLSASETVYENILELDPIGRVCERTYICEVNISSRDGVAFLADSATGHGFITIRAEGE